jgi:hypothetical protein
MEVSNMKKCYEVIEVCPHCDNENIYNNLNVKKNGYIAKCNDCEEEIFLCDECMHAKDNPTMSCNWCATGTGGKCFRGETKNNAVVYFNVECFERILYVKYPNSFDNKFQEMHKILSNAYDKWHSAEEIEDDEEREYVQCICLEEFMIEELSKTYPEWIKWKSKYYGEDDVDESDYWVVNERG